MELLALARRFDLPEKVLSLSTLGTPDYADLFTATIHDSRRSPEDWARSLAAAAGLAGQFVWRVVLGLRLDSRPSPERIGGWKVADRGDWWITLEAASWFLTANIVVRLDDDQVSVATLVRYDRPVAAVAWPPLSIVHRRAMPGVLRHAVRTQ